MTKPPFPTLPKTTLARGATVPEGFGPQPFDLAKCEIADDPLPTGRITTDGKYKAVFESLKPGQCVKVPPDQVNRIANAMRKHIEQFSDKTRFVTRSVKNYGDGLGRVWLIELPKKLKAVA